MDETFVRIAGPLRATQRPRTTAAARAGIEAVHMIARASAWDHQKELALDRPGWFGTLLGLK